MVRLKHAPTSGRGSAGKALLHSMTACVVFSLIVECSVCLADDGFDREFLSQFLVGTYRIVGKWPDSPDTYTGVAVISREGYFLRVEREIGGEKDAGTGEVKRSETDGIPVLKITFQSAGLAYEGTYIWSSDLDNYARISGYVTRQGPGRRTKDPGMECFFIRQPALE